MGEPVLGPRIRQVEAVGDDDLTRMLRDLPDAVLVVDATGDVRWANASTERMFGRSIGESVGMSGLDFVHPEDLHFVLLSLVSIQDKEVGAPIEVRLRTPDGWRLVEMKGSPITWFDTGCVLLSLRDLTDRRRFELAHNQDARFRAVVQNAAVVTMLVAPDGTVMSCSGALSRLLGHDPELVEGRPLAHLVEHGDRHALETALARSAQGSRSIAPVTVCVNLSRKMGSASVPFELAVVNLVDDPSVGGYVITGHDITDRMRLEEELSYQAFHDSLTGLGNRALFQNRLTHALERTERSRDQLAALFLDMDGLKEANDRFGHAVGDALLRSMGAVLVGNIRKADTAARLGGDEFGVIVEDFDHPGEVFALAERILDECRQPMVIGRTTVSATVSIGFSFSEPGITLDELMSHADRAMYTAKDRGKDRFEKFEEWMLVATESV
ncbi:MAG: sensor domain-containing diguanylate cyclase [Acidimicrobiales bacterium]